MRWLFFSDTAKVNLWSGKLNRYVSYPVRINDKGDVWIEKEGGKIHGRTSGDKIIWDEPQSAGIRQRVSGHRFTIEDKELKIYDE